ncbi:hypothetical protein HPG69_007368 [Diceros bicornis minor]|uniref:Uncharacterized protein n=1 Tax=Diceros bicornis minor TaxID=77932 RepID=A0A7J7EKS3_DICBM|nr:hypothetical protein HPG69_007368 [Diceros bicornis minor]
MDARMQISSLLAHCSLENKDHQTLEKQEEALNQEKLKELAIIGCGAMATAATVKLLACQFSGMAGHKQKYTLYT